jgi:hypothetical protein
MVPGTEGMTFPTYYKGTGTARLYYSDPDKGSIECTLDNLVFVAVVGSMEGRISVTSIGEPGYTSSGGLQCQPKQDKWPITDGNYSVDGTYYLLSEISFETSDQTRMVDVKFNKAQLWGSATFTLTRLSGSWISQKECQFELDNATEAEYNAAIAN